MVSATAALGGGSRFRQRKLNVKAALAILKESDIESDTTGVAGTGDDAADAALGIGMGLGVGGLPKVESGVESKEEKEHHLQAVINASQTAALGGKVGQQIFIPTPDAVPSEVPYDKLYPPTFAQTATYIRFSSTVEDCIGCPYCMTEEEEEVLKSINARQRNKMQQCSEDQFEQVMNFFEETSQARQPFASVDNTPLLGYEEMASAFDETVDEGAKRFAPAIYEYWKGQRLKKGNRALVAKLKTLKMDAAQEADDSDPYVCFRRREVRLVRKTRGRDAQIGEKLKKLRKELEEGRQLLDLVRRRELGRRDDLALSRDIFEKRAAVKDMKRTLNIEFGEDDDLLINQRTPKKRPADVPIPAARPAQQLRLIRNDSVATPEPDPIVLLKDKIREQEQKVMEKTSQMMAQLELANENFVDRTEEAILGLFDSLDLHDEAAGWVCAKVVEVTQQPTPPESVSSDAEDAAAGTVEVFWASEEEIKANKYAPRCRLRRGRGGLFMDRRFPTDQQQKLDEVDDRWKYDCESGDEVEPEVLDPYSTEGFFYREFLRKTDRRRSPDIRREDVQSLAVVIGGGGVRRA